MTLFDQSPKVLPVSFAQQRMWFLDRLLPPSAAYHVSDAFRLRGRLDVAVLGRALNEVVARHEALRTTFPAVDGQPTQLIAAVNPIDLQLVDLRGEAEPEREAKRRGSEEGRAPFDLGGGPLLRATVMVLGADDHVLVVTMHHIVTDGWSAAVFTSELSSLYRAFRDGRPSPLPDLATQYGDFSARQRESMHGATLADLHSYWSRQLRGCPPVVDLATDRPRPAVRAGRGARVPVHLSAPVVAALDDLAHAQRASLFMVLLSAFDVLLARYSGQDDFAVGSAISGRTHTSTEGLIGLFVNTLVLRADLSGDPTFVELVARIREVALDAYDHQDLPFDLLVEAAHPERQVGYTPLFQHLFVFQNTPKQSLTLADVEVTVFALERDGSMFDLALDLALEDDVVTGWLEYDSDLFDAPTVAQMASHYLGLLDAVVAGADRPVSQLEMLDGAERDQLLVGFNATTSPFPDQTIHGCFEDWANRQPDVVAVRDTVTSLTYGQLNAAANRLAHHLRSVGVGPESRVGICVSRDAAMVAAMLGVLKAGGGYVPLDPDYPAARLAFMLDDAAVAVVITESRLVGRLPAERCRVVCLDEDGPAIASRPSTNPVGGAGPENLAYVIYTSGSTGRPKGVMIEHRGVVSVLTAAGRGFRAAELRVVVAAASVCFDLSVFEIFVALLNGGSVFVAADLLDGDWWQAQPTLVSAVPSVLRSLLTARDLPPSVVTVVLAGEALGAELVRTIWDRTPKASPRRRLINIYGPTETTIYATAAEIDPTTRLGGIVGIGRPVANTRIYLLDGHRQPVPIGVTGEIFIGGVGVGRGYLNPSQSDDDRFVIDPFDSQAPSRLYRSGDLARWRRDGTIDFVGRIDDQVKIRGFRIEPSEVRAALLTHPCVADAAIVVGDEPAGERRLVAYVVADPADVLPSALRTHMTNIAPRYMVPAEFVLVDSLPRTASGKLDRRALPPPKGAAPIRAPIPARTRTERVLADIWAEALGLTSVGVTDNFFDLGGHSLLAAQVVARAENAFGRKLPLALILRAGTIEALARMLDQGDRDILWRTVFPLRSGGSGPPIFCVHGLTGTVTAYRQVIPYFVDHPVYGIQCLGLDGESTPYERVEDMAHHYLDEVQAVQAEGPYIVIGICFGSLVAFEMAHQLKTARGCEVALVALIDPTPLPERTFTERASRRVAKFRQLGAGDRVAFMRETMKVTVEIVVFKARRRLRRRPQSVAEVNSRASATYAPPTYDGAVVVYRSDGLRTHPDEHRAAAWPTLEGSNVEVVDIPGISHTSILTEATVPIVATHLRRRVEGALAEATTGQP